MGTLRDERGNVSFSQAALSRRRLHGRMGDFGGGFADPNRSPEDYICLTEIMLRLAGLHCG
jgi:hypothetical protein